MEIGKVLGEEHQEALLLGNEAVARGAIEAGVQVASAYPGTPSSEIVGTLGKVAHDAHMHVQWSVNEKVALEVGAGVAMAGGRALVCMKHVGLNVAADPFMSLMNTGIKGGLVLAIGDDPGMHSSQNEQDTRIYGIFAKIITLIPSNVQEAKDFIKKAFDISEKCGVPVIVRLTTRICHSRGKVTFGSTKEEPNVVEFGKDPTQWVIIPAYARGLYKKLLGRQNMFSSAVEELQYNTIEGDGEFGVVCSGVVYNYVKEAYERAGCSAKILKVGALPLSENTIHSFKDGVTSIFVYEEGDPVLEDLMVRHCGNIVKGKRTGDVPWDGEITVDVILKTENTCETGPTAPTRPPLLCSGCSHRAMYYAMKRSGAKVVSGDIGCYTLGVMPPLLAVDTCLCMGASINMASGMYFAGEKTRVAAAIGDSTFIHTGVNGLMNAVYNDAHITVVILDNSTTAMTGHQPHPLTGKKATGEDAKQLNLLDIVKACGVEHIKTINPHNIPEAIKAMKEANEYEGVSVVIAQAPCNFVDPNPSKKQPSIDGCKKCLVCINKFCCPALKVVEGGTVDIDYGLCNGCGDCIEVCPHNAIQYKDGDEE